ncbi:hypothetical protein RHMOL_Rhmol01G0218300 [Rhododendron molle]|uniref:Uncharacterized protein n=1 Tax=Rhododendron molle TaxID=49168 RepID=A0ACC0Q3P7_RHOML|nr:hypothetical protein RHMOL_Rhmol01G0218300 [Rhododendron molle]
MPTSPGPELEINMQAVDWGIADNPTDLKSQTSFPTPSLSTMMSRISVRYPSRDGIRGTRGGYWVFRPRYPNK